MVDFREHISEDENVFQRLCKKVPGFSGYHEREVRRSADKMLREYLVGMLAEAQQELQRVTEEFARAARLAPLNDLDRLAKRLRTVTDQIRYADYGYTGLFDAVKIKEEELDRVYEYDASMMALIDDITRAMRALAAAGTEDHDEALGAASKAVDELTTMVRDRENVFVRLMP